VTHDLAYFRPKSFITLPTEQRLWRTFKSRRTHSHIRWQSSIWS